jgi:hypothetical protein
MTPGSTVMIARDPAGDEEDKPLSLTIIAPKKPKKKPPQKPEPETVGVGAAAKKGDGERVSGDEDTSPHDDSES